jgi:hypothetical protein
MEAAHGSSVSGVSQLRLAGILLIATLFLYATVIVFTITRVFSRFPNGLGLLTPIDMMTFRGDFVLFQLLALVAIGAGTGGLAVSATSLLTTRARTWAQIALICAAAAFAAVLLAVAARFTLLNFTEPTLGESATWQWTTWVFDYVAAPIQGLATLVASVALAVSDVLRRTGLVVAVLSGILIVLAVVAGFPPFVFAFLWLALGIGLLRRTRTSLTE